MKKEIYLRDGVSKIEQLKPYSFWKKDGVTRYCFHQMKSIFETSLGFDCRGCQDELVKLGFNIPVEDYGYDKGKPMYCDFWHYQLDAVFRREVRNDQTNSIYVGTPKGIDYKKLKVQPNDWQKMMLEKWNELFSHLADKHGWIKIELWW